MTLSRLPPACLEKHVAILGTSDAGKTYAAKGEVEQLLGAKARVGVIDPTGVWWGLRSAPGLKDGRGFDVVIFGGDHADLPIPDNGERLAEVVAGGDFSWIIDTSRLSVGKRTRFFADFAEGLQRFNRAPLHLVIDEAHLFAPQNPMRDIDTNRMLHATNNLVSGGRVLGIRVLLLSQRPAKLHKDSLTQVQTLVAMFMFAPQDRNAVEAWIADQADKALGAEILASLPTLQVGEGWVWAPRLGVLERAKFGKIVTFDSSAAPDASRPRPELAPLDLASLREVLAADLEAETPAEKGPKSAPSRATIAAAEARGYERGLIEGRKRGHVAGQALALTRARSAIDALLVQNDLPDADGPDAATNPLPGEGRARAPARPVFPPPPPSGDNAARLLHAIRRAPRVLNSWEEAALLGGFHPAGGAFRVARKALRAAGEVIEGADGAVQATDGNRLGEIRLDDVIKRWSGQIEGYAPKMLARIVAAGGSYPIADLNEALGLSPVGGAARTAWKRLRDRNLIVVRDGLAKLAPILMELPR